MTTDSRLEQGLHELEMAHPLGLESSKSSASLTTLAEPSRLYNPPNARRSVTYPHKNDRSGAKFSAGSAQSDQTMLHAPEIPQFLQNVGHKSMTSVSTLGEDTPSETRLIVAPPPKTELSPEELKMIKPPPKRAAGTWVRFQVWFTAYQYVSKYTMHL